MDLEEVSRTAIKDNSEELVLRTDKSNVQFLGYVLETVEGMCHYTTIDKEKSLIKIVYTLDFKDDVDKIITSLKESTR